jgi:hypothetical protein
MALSFNFSIRILYCLLFKYWDHRYRKSLFRLLKVCYVPTTSAVLIAFFSSFLMRQLTVLMKQTRQLVHAVKQSIYLDDYDWGSNTFDETKTDFKVSSFDFFSLSFLAEAEAEMVASSSVSVISVGS